MSRTMRCWLILASLPIYLSLQSGAFADEQLQSLGKNAKDTDKSKAIVQQLLNRKDLGISTVLGAMKSQSDIAKNYYLSLAQAIADRDPTKAVEECKQIVARTDEDSTGRFWAFTYVTTYLPTQREKLLEAMTEDPSPELRFEAIEFQLKKLESSTKSAEAKLEELEQLLKKARLPEQVQGIAKKLEEGGKKPDLLKLFGFISQWNVVGPFNNVNQSGFSVVYAPEKEFLDGKLSGKLDALKYQGKDAEVMWKPINTDKADGKIDLNAAYSNAKGAIVYAVGSFESSKSIPAELRIGSTNAVKVWFNNKLVVDREVYHAGDQIDQYIAPVELKSGKNSILVKVCQNEQTEQWAQDWFFQLRIADSTGLAIQPAIASK